MMLPSDFTAPSRCFRHYALLTALAVGVALPLEAQQSQPSIAPPPELSPAIRSEVVDSLSAQTTRFYAVADTGRLIGEHLQRRLRSGAYNAITIPALLAEALSTDLKAINQDRHLSVSVRSPGMMVMPMGQSMLPPINFSPPPASPPQALAAARRTNFNIGRVEVLPGNVGYLEVRAFSQLTEARDAIVAALRLLEHTDAMIVDVRDHMGGSADLSNFLISHFTGPDTVHSLDVTIRAANQTMQRWTLPSVPGPRRPDVPLYVLTSRGTVSAGEDFAFVMKNLGRATLVGETTTGAGRNNPSFDIGHGFAASISVSTVKDPRTGAEWEGVGVKPQIAVPPRTALGVAHAHALQNLAQTADSPARKRELELAREFVEAQNRAHAIAPEELQKFQGVYGGERTITLENGRLIFRRMPERLGQELTPLSDTTFALGPVMRIAFEPGGPGKMRLRFVPPMGEPLVFDRTGPAPAIASEYR